MPNRPPLHPAFTRTERQDWSPLYIAVATAAFVAAVVIVALGAIVPHGTIGIVVAVGGAAAIGALIERRDTRQASRIDAAEAGALARHARLSAQLDNAEDQAVARMREVMVAREAHLMQEMCGAMQQTLAQARGGDRVAMQHALSQVAERFSGQIEAARDMGRAEAVESARIREAHMRDEFAADLDVARRDAYARGVEVGAAHGYSEGLARGQQMQASERESTGLGVAPEAEAALRRINMRLINGNQDN